MNSKSLVSTLFLSGILISSLVYSPFILDYTLTTRLFTITVCLLICFFILYKANEKIKINIDLLLASYIAFIAFSCISIFWANTKSESLLENSRLFISLSVFLLSVYLIKKDKPYALTMLCKIAVVVFAIEFLLVLYQACQLTVFTKEALYSIYGANSHKNLLSSFLLLNLFFLALGIRQLNAMWKYASIVCLIVNIAFIGLLQTKAVWVGLLVSAIVFLLLLLYKKMNFKLNFKVSLVLCMIIANLFFIFVLPQLIKKGISHNTLEKNIVKTELDNERLLLWDKSYYMIRNYPIFGVATGNWQIHFPDATLKGLWRAEDLNYTFQRPHNDFLWILAETGFIGFNLFLLFLFSIILSLIEALKAANEKSESLYTLILCSLILSAYFTASFFDFPKERIEHLIWINIILALIYCLIKENLTIKTVRVFNLNKNYFAVLLVAILFVLIISIFRYKGEYYTRKMYDQKAINNSAKVIKEGEKALNFAYRIDPMSIPIKWYMGNAEVTIGNLQEARSDLFDALELNPYNRNVLNDLASVYVALNQSDLAKKYYFESCRISPRFDDPKLNLAVLYINQKQFEKADSCLKSLLHDSERRTNYQKMVNAFLGKAQ